MAWYDALASIGESTMGVGLAVSKRENEEEERLHQEKLAQDRQNADYKRMVDGKNLDKVNQEARIKTQEEVTRLGTLSEYENPNTNTPYTIGQVQEFEAQYGTNWQEKVGATVIRDRKRIEKKVETREDMEWAAKTEVEVGAIKEELQWGLEYDRLPDDKKIGSKEEYISQRGYGKLNPEAKTTVSEEEYFKLVKDAGATWDAMATEGTDVYKLIVDSTRKLTEDGEPDPIMAKQLYTTKYAQFHAQAYTAANPKTTPVGAALGRMKTQTSKAYEMISTPEGEQKVREAAEARGEDPDAAIQAIRDEYAKLPADKGMTEMTPEEATGAEKKAKIPWTDVYKENTNKWNDWLGLWAQNFFETMESTGLNDMFMRANNAGY